jgi:uncharacterized delta-60 repeat protein
MNRTKLSLAFLFTIVLSLNIFAQDIDAGFLSDLKQALSADSPVNITIQPDGKIIHFGVHSRSAENNLGRTFIVRTNLDGSQDTTFNYTSSESSVSSVVVRQDGKLLVGLDSGFNSTPLIILLNADGSRDLSFNTSFSNCGSIHCGTHVYAVQSDGSFYATRILVGNGIGLFYLNRFFSNGSLDSSFQSLVFDTRLGRNFIGKLEILSDGKLMICGLNSTNGVLFRLNMDGTKDVSFESPTVLYSNNLSSFPFISTFIIKNDEKLIVSGRFNSINGVSFDSFSRLNSNGSVDLQFVTDFTATEPSGIVSQKLLNGKYIMWFSRLGFPGINNYVRFNTNDTVDTTFTSTLGGGFLLDGQNRVTTSRFRLNDNGTLDTSYVIPAIKVDGNVTAIARQADNKIIVAGNFDFANSTSRSKITRLNTDGIIDQTFDSGTGFDVAPNRVEVQADGKILVAGDFTSYRGAPASFLVRLNPSGTLDTTFTTSLENSVYSIVPLANGKALIGGIFSSFNGVSRPGLARLNSDGSLDSAFNASISNASIQTVFLQADGKIMVGGFFTGIGGFSRSNLARINSDGTLDNSFNAGTISEVLNVIQSNGKYVVNLSDKVRRLNNGGIADGSFQSITVNGAIKSMHVQSDGAVIIGGSSFTVNGVLRRGIARLKNDGTFSNSFLVDSTNSTVNSLLGLPDGKVYVGGDFTRIGNTPRIGLARLNVIQDITLQAFNRFDFDGDGKADIAVYRPSNNNWYRLNSSNGSFSQINFGIGVDRIAPADFDADGKADLSVFRPTTGTWWKRDLPSGNFLPTQWGTNGDLAVPSDFDGDGKADNIIFRPSTGVWYRLRSSNGSYDALQFGISSDVPVIVDFDGDGKSDIAVFRPSEGNWYWLDSSTGQFHGVHFGQNGDLAVPADYDGDGKTELAVFRQSTGDWFFIDSSSGLFRHYNFGLSADKPVAADYDGDGKADIAVYRPSTGTWYLQRSQLGFTSAQFGIAEDIPVPFAYIR